MIDIEEIFSGNKENVLFYYSLKDAWNCSIQNILLVNKDVDNLFYVGEENEINKVTISKEDLNKVVDIISNSGILKIKKFKEPFVFDGYFNDFYFSNLEYSNEIGTSNLSYYIDDDNAPKEAKLLISLFYEIASILKKYNIEFNLEELDENFEDDE